MELIKKFKNLPDELIHIIINYPEARIYQVV